MLRFTALAVALSLSTTCLADDAKDKAAKLDPAKLVGNWTYVSGMKAGEAVAKDRLAGTVKVVKDTMTLPSGDGGPSFVINYKVDGKSSPATIDLDIKDGPVKEGKALGIIKMDGDTFTFCYSPTGAKRPTKFESTKDNGAFLFTLRRAAK